MNSSEEVRPATADQTCNSTWRWTTNRRRRMYGFRPCGLPAVAIETHPAGDFPRCVQHTKH